MRVLLFLGLVWVGTARAQSIVTVTNAASHGASVPGNGIAPGSLVTVQVIRGGPVPINPDLSKVSLKLRPQGGGDQIDAQVLQGFVGSYLALLPRNTAQGAYEATLTVDGQAALPTMVQAVPAAFGLFARGRAGFGPALAQNVGPSRPLALNLFTAPARPGDYLILWGTGLGDATAGSVTVEIAGRPVTPSYAGPSPAYPGLDQINVPLPADTPDSCFVSVLVRARDSISNESVFAKAGVEGVCTDPFGFREDELRALDEDKNVRLGLLSLRSEVMQDIPSPTQAIYQRNEAASGEFTRRDAEEIAMLAQPLLTDDAYFSCRLLNPVTVARFSLSEDFDAGDSLQVQGPGKSLEAAHSNIPVVYLNVLPPKNPQDTPFFTAGTWTVRAPGGRTVRPLEVSRQLPPLLRWQNRESLVEIDRTRDQTVIWAGDGYTADDVMTVTLGSASSPQARASAVSCRAPASAGRLTIPASMATELARIPIGRLELRLTPRPNRRGRVLTCR